MYNLGLILFLFPIIGTIIILLLILVLNMICSYVIDYKMLEIFVIISVVFLVSGGILIVAYS